jgi:predicted GNAT family acetyltransferase
MVATEADIPQVAQLGAVYTAPAFRGLGLARSVTAALCAEKLRHRERAALVVRDDNLPALRAYQALGFHYWDDYRMSRLA